jgi:protein TonB
MKKVRATRTKVGVGRGTVVVGFTIATDGGLASVRVLKSSGNAHLDDIAIDHIRRSAPFPPPPATAATRFSFEFIGR